MHYYNVIKVPQSEIMWDFKVNKMLQLPNVNEVFIIIIIPIFALFLFGFVLFPNTFFAIQILCCKTKPETKARNQKHTTTKDQNCVTLGFFVFVSCFILFLVNWIKLEGVELSSGGVAASVDVGVAQEDVGRVVKKQKTCARSSSEVLERAIDQVTKNYFK